MNAQPTTALEKNPVKSLLSQEVIKKKFEEVLGTKAPQFMASIANAGLNLPGVEPMSIIAAAFVAATLDLPIDKNLGFAHIVPYKDKQGGKVAQFQMGYKGFIQLALRTGQYERMNARPINKDAFGGYDEVGEPRILWEKIDETEEPVGYAFAWKLTSGFIKVVYWTKKKVEAHAKRYSQAFKSGKTDTPWVTNKDAMALKTVINDALGHWGIMSIQMQQAALHDKGAQRQIGAAVEYIDGEAVESIGPSTNTQQPESQRLRDSLKSKAAAREEECTELRELIRAKLMSTGSDETGMNGALKAASVSEDDHKWLQLDNLHTCSDPQALRDILTKLEGPF